MRQECSKAEEDFKEEAEVEAEDISTRAHLQVHKSEKRSIFLQYRANNPTPKRQLRM